MIRFPPVFWQQLLTRYYTSPISIITPEYKYRMAIVRVTYGRADVQDVCDTIGIHFGICLFSLPISYGRCSGRVAIFVVVVGRRSARDVALPYHTTIRALILARIWHVNADSFCTIVGSFEF